MKGLLLVLAFVFSALLIQPNNILADEFYWHEYDKWEQDSVIDHLSFSVPDGKCLIIENVRAKITGTHDLDALKDALSILAVTSKNEKYALFLSLYRKKDVLAAALKQWNMELNEKIEQKLPKLPAKTEVTFWIDGGLTFTKGSGFFRVDVSGTLIDDSSCSNQ